MRSFFVNQYLFFIGALACASNGVVADSRLQVIPASVRLDRPEGMQQLLVMKGGTSTGLDVSRRCTFETTEPQIVDVDGKGRVIPKRDGKAAIVVRCDDEVVHVPVVVVGLGSPAPVSFRREVLPILTKSGCSSGGCHGKAEGQNGFRLSIFGYDAVADHNAVVKEARGRRVSTAAPKQSLLLKKATGMTPHGGGAKIELGSPWYRRIERWISEGTQLDDEASQGVSAIDVYPKRIEMAPNGEQQLLVTAIGSDGTRRCVTVEAEFDSNAKEIATADRDGKIRVSNNPGEAAILVRYLGHVGICCVTIPQDLATFQRPEENNFIDRAVWNKLEQLGIQPSQVSNDATFLRRVYLDTIGSLPAPDEVRRFMADLSPDKRARQIDQLLKRPEYADFWAMKWADILRVDKAIVKPQGALAMTRWLRDQFHDNTPYDQFARKIVMAEGNTLAEGPASFYEVHKDPEMLGRSVSQIFLGVRIECAECHHHPFERWGQADYYAFAGFFTGVQRNKAASGGRKIYSRGGVNLKHPQTGVELLPVGLGAKEVTLDGVEDRRDVLSQWMTSPENPFFARMIVNRIWSHYFGRGLVEPIDDLRATNPATNEPLLEALADHLIAKRYDLKAFTRSVLNTNAYQLESVPNFSNEMDSQNFSHAAWKAMPAEVLLDAICQATGVPEQFNGWPEGYRAIQIWDNRMPSYFFRVFGRPQRVSVCECERGNEPSIAQALHLMNSPESVRKIRHRDGLAARLAASESSSAQIIEEIYLATLCRQPTSAEQALMQQAFQEPGVTRREASEDILWTLLNTREFVYNH